MENQAKQIDLSIVIVVFNNLDDLNPCLESIYSKEHDITFEVILVDNGSKDGTVDFVKDNYPQVQIIEAGYNSGFAGGNNIGYRHSSGRYLMFLNPDTIVHDDALTTLVRFADSKENCGALGPNVRNSDGTLQVSCWPKKGLLHHVYATFMVHRIPLLKRIINIGRYTPSQFENEMEVYNLHGCCLSVPKKIFDEIGGFDEDYFIYAEEIDLCERIHKSGYKLFYTPTARITHLGGSSTIKQKSWCVIQFEKSRRRFFKKHCHKFEDVIVRNLVLITAFRKYLFYSFKSLLNRKNSEKEMLIARAYSDLILWIFGLKTHGPRPK